ncbi:MAG: zinc ribbon domain-containing protein, partial [Clostridia bacterium]|nr:zinc ribbon domain-containing protein [Clostridia bacterium]
MFCKSCGNQVADNERFCPYCGVALAPQPAQHVPNQPQYPPQQQYRGPAAAAPSDKKSLFGLITTIAFGAAALFALLGMIGFCTNAYLGSHAGMIISTIFVILSCGGIAIAPFLKEYTKICITASSALLFLGMYGISILQIA